MVKLLSLPRALSGEEVFFEAYKDGQAQEDILFVQNFISLSGNQKNADVPNRGRDSQA